VRAGELIDEARRQLGELAGVQPETVSALGRDGDEAWVVTVEAVELERVPNTMDLMGTYEITLSSDGRLIGFRRVGRYQRSATS
jgi:hypothetical protein